MNQAPSVTAGRRKAGAAAGLPLTLFAFLWAAATQIHLMSFHFWAHTWQGWTLVLCVSLVLLQPQSLFRFAAMVAASLANLFQHLPFVPNHILFEGLVNLTILIGLAWSVWKHRSDLRTSGGAVGWGIIWAPPAAVIGIGLTLLNRWSTQPDACGFVTIFMILFFQWWTRSTNGPASISAEAYRSLAGVLRWQLVLMYVWAVIQKLNWDYLDPDVSAAVRLQWELEALFHLPASPDSWRRLIIWGSLATELGIPLLLLIRPLRRAGFILAIAFHAWLAFHPFPGIYSFSALVYAMLFFFLTEEKVGALRKLWHRQRRFLSRKLHLPMSPTFHGGMFVAGFFALGMINSKLYATRGHNADTFALVNANGLRWFLLWAVWLGASYLFVFRARRVLPISHLAPLRVSPALIGLLLVFVNGLNPWIGLKTQTSFSMFSNLRTEFLPNHLFLRRVDLFSYQQDIIEIVSAEPDLLSPGNTPRSIEQFANPGQIMPFFELRRLLSRVDGDVRVVISRGGVEETIIRCGDNVSHPEAFERPSLLERKLLWFRRHTDWDGPMPFTH